MVRAYLRSQPLLWESAQEGKMFGVLIVETDAATHSLGFIAAFSAQLAGRTVWPWFVPPIVDILHPDSYFLSEEAHIDELSRRIESLQRDERFLSLLRLHRQQSAFAAQTLKRERQALAEKKLARDEARRLASPELLRELSPSFIAESQRLKADFKRLQRRLQSEIEQTAELLRPYELKIKSLKAERQQRSVALQNWVFAQHSLLNAHGVSRPLTDFFSGLPPSGAGECCAPKLLQCAFRHQWRPRCMAEFWVGHSPAEELRTDGNFYPACRSKCRPILAHMLQGLEVEPNPVLQRNIAMARHLQIVYADSDIIVVSKPSGMLSVPGNDEVPSVKEEVEKRFPDMEGPIVVHRLDMDTSGLMVLARHFAAYRKLQSQFEHHTIRKRYEAIVEGCIQGEGTISLPLCPNPSDRPRQMVSPTLGKQATTHYRAVRAESSSTTRLHLFPVTGRTHQLRVHCAHPEGLHAPIVGDALYGTAARRLLLHAAEITFRHPRDGRELHFLIPPDF